jgi:hypothetical protein
MTSFIIKAHETRELPVSWKNHQECPFCRIISGDGPAFKVYEDEKVIAFLGTRAARVWRNKVTRVSVRL